MPWALPPVFLLLSLPSLFGCPSANYIGEINAAAVSFAGFEVPNQNYSMSMWPFSSPSLSHLRAVLAQSSSAAGPGVDGILGLGPSSSSVVRNTIGDSSGDPFLDNVFRQNVSTANYITFLLARQGDPGSTVQEQLTINEIVPSYEAINSQPKLPVKALPGPLRVDQHWAGFIEGIIGPDNNTIPLSSLVAGTPSGQAVVIYDSGFTFPQMSNAVSDALYGRVQGARFDTQNNLWTLPCDQEVNLTIVIGGQKYPVHPLDTVSSDFNATDANGNPTCVGTVSHSRTLQCALSC
jgi:hypothetical protein